MKRRSTMIKGNSLVLEHETPAPLPPKPAGTNLPLPEELFLARVGVAVRVLRLNCRYTQARLARAAGITTATLARMERGETAGTIITITAVERALACKPGWIIRLAS